jgi:hypothetical protein
VKTAFVLGGGGVLGAHEVGMLRALSEAGIRPDVVVGTSVGAINGAWRRGVRRLEQAGRPDLAARAKDMPNLLAPRAGGALSAIAACPDADVIFVAHAGLDRLVSVRDVWRNLPMDQVVRAQWWRVPHGEVPRSADREAQVRWLYDWWERIDSWISVNRPGDAATPALSPGQ